MSTRKLSKSHKAKLLRVLVLSAFMIALLLQLIPIAQASVETDFMTIMNAERIRLGKTSLAINPSLTTAAYLHSKDMAENNYFSHTSQDGRTFVQRIVAAGYTGYSSLGENIAYAYGTADAAIVYDMWKNSAGHYANMIGDFNEAGLGVYSIRGYTYYTLDLGKRATITPPTPPPPITPTVDFSISASPSAISIQAGSSGTATLTVTSLHDFSGTVTITGTYPSGWAVSTPTSIAVTSGSSKSATFLIVVATTVQAGAYTVTLTATSGSTSHSKSLTVNVAAAPPQTLKDFSISVSPSTVNVKPGSTATIDVTVTSLGGLTGTVSFRTTAPTGWTAACSPSWVTLNSGSSVSSTMSINVPSIALLKMYTFWIIGVGNSFSRSAAITVNVQANSQPTQTTPSAPQNLQATAGDSQIALSWAAPTSNGGSSITNYRIYRRTATTETLLATVSNVQSYSDYAVTNGQTSYYRVAAINSVGESPKSNEASATPSTPLPPPAPSTEGLNIDIKASSTTVSRGSYAALTITVTDGATGSPLKGASVSIRLQDPTGATAGNAILSTGSAGTALAGMGFGSTVPTGIYTVSVTVSLAGYESKTAQTTFTVS